MKTRNESLLLLKKEKLQLVNRQKQRPNRLRKISLKLESLPRRKSNRLKSSKRNSKMTKLQQQLSSSP